jgi:hypothetical protein
MSIIYLPPTIKQWQSSELHVCDVNLQHKITLFDDLVCWTCCSSSCAEGGQEDDNVHRWSDGLILEDGSNSWIGSVYNTDLRLL